MSLGNFLRIWGLNPHLGMPEEPAQGRLIRHIELFERFRVTRQRPIQLLPKVVDSEEMAFSAFSTGNPQDPPPGSDTKFPLVLPRA